MGKLFVEPYSMGLIVSDEVLDQVREMIENSAAAHTGFWIAGAYHVERNGVPDYPDPTYGHQRVWIPAGMMLTLCYDRPTHPDPDRIVEEPFTIFV